MFEIVARKLSTDENVMLGTNCSAHVVHKNPYTMAVYHTTNIRTYILL